MMDEREGLELSLLGVVVDDMATSMAPHLDRTKTDMGIPFNKIIGLLEEMPAIAHQLLGRIIAAIRGWTATGIEPTWIKYGMHLLQASTDHRSDRRLITDRLIKIKTTDGSTRCPLLLLRRSH